MVLIADVYRRFAAGEARGVSQVYEEWAGAIATDDAVIERLSALPSIKRQPNLLFAAARAVGARVGRYAEFRAFLLARWPEVEQVMLARRTQTNEAGRCAVLLPLLSSLPGPLALVEVGASAGLCLYPDRYSYRFDTADGIVALDPDDGPSPVQLPCRIDASGVPDRLPEVVWRAGVDLHPVDLGDPAELQWLETLIWPEHQERRRRLHAAAALVAAAPPHLVTGDLVAEIQQLVAAAPADATVVVFHSAVLVYLESERRQEFAEMMMTMPGVAWISNEGPAVLPEMTGHLSERANGRTVLALNGGPVALVGPHGQSYETLSPRSAWARPGRGREVTGINGSLFGEGVRNPLRAKQP